MKTPPLTSRRKGPRKRKGRLMSFKFTPRRQRVLRAEAQRQNRTMTAVLEREIDDFERDKH